MKKKDKKCILGQKASDLYQTNKQPSWLQKSEPGGSPSTTTTQEKRKCENFSVAADNSCWTVHIIGHSFLASCTISNDIQLYSAGMNSSSLFLLWAIIRRRTGSPWGLDSYLTPNPFK